MINKAEVKKFAVEARRKLLSSVKAKAGLIGVTENGIAEPITKGQDYAVYPTDAGIETTLAGKQLGQRANLAKRINEIAGGDKAEYKRAYESVMEEAAYTWFNRIIAVRFMEINGYLPSGIRVLSSEAEGKIEPDIVTLAPDIDLPLSPQEIDEIISLKAANKLDELFRVLFIKQCNELGKLLPGLFENTSLYDRDYTEILLDISYTNEDGVIRSLLELDESYFLDQVEIIGWMYQYYNTELKDETYLLLKKNVKITKERIPAVTQLFTPDWIVRYMVENSLGRLWQEGHPNDAMKTSWRYYINEAEQEPEVAKRLEEIREEYRMLKLENIKVLDPCMGSGHILVYAFDVLMQIYESCGYTQRDAARLIVEKNLYGLDIDDRAYQLAYFAVMMKGRKYDRRFLERGITPNLCAIKESDGLQRFGNGTDELNICDQHKDTANYLIDTFRDAKEYGAILNVEPMDYDGLLECIEEYKAKSELNVHNQSWLRNQYDLMIDLIKQAKIMSQKYDVVVTNPPYMGSSNMNAKLSNYVSKNYPDSKSDLFAVFIEKCSEFIEKNRYQAMITQHSWMFLSSFEKLRRKLLRKDIVNMAHLGARAFDEIGGEVVQTTSFVLRNGDLKGYKAIYKRLVDYIGQQAKENAFFDDKNVYLKRKESFERIPGMPIAYWASERLIDAFEKGEPLGKIAEAKQGLATADNDRFLRLWYEVSYMNEYLCAKNKDDAVKSGRKWFPYNKGGEYRKWYGNNDYVVNWENDGREIRNFKDAFGKLRSRPQNIEYYFREGLTWSSLSSSKLSMRYSSVGHIFDTKGSMCFAKDAKILLYILGLLNSNVTSNIMEVLCPTLDFSIGGIANTPVIFSDTYKPRVDELVSQNIAISKADWDSFETSWDFKKHPLIAWRTDSGLISDAFDNWADFAESQFTQLKANEEELNRIFIEIYGLQGELTPDVEDKDVTVRKADLQRDIRSFISYAVGCMFGRYSLDVDGLAYAGGEWDDSKYKTFVPDKDNILPITDEEYFSDDIVARFVEFVKAAYGEDTLSQNLAFIASALGNKGSTPREVIRNYFLKDFYKDHVKIYKKRPIYWMFDSGKENAFKALIYLHRYDEDTVGRVRVDYLHKVQAAIESAIGHCDMVLSGDMASPADKAKAMRQKEKLVKQLAETRLYDQAIAHIALQRIRLDLDDGVAVNYAKFQDVEVSSEGKKPIKIDLLAKI